MRHGVISDSPPLCGGARRCVPLLIPPSSSPPRQQLRFLIHLCPVSLFPQPSPYCLSIYLSSPPPTVLLILLNCYSVYPPFALPVSLSPLPPIHSLVSTTYEFLHSGAPARTPPPEATIFAVKVPPQSQFARGKSVEPRMC